MGRLLRRAPCTCLAGIAAVGAGALTAAGAGCRGAGLCALACLVPRRALECGRMMARHIDLLTPEAVADAIAVSLMDAVSAAAAAPNWSFSSDSS